MGYSLAYYLVKDYIMALKILSEYRKTMIVVRMCVVVRWLTPSTVLTPDLLS